MTEIHKIIWEHPTIGNILEYTCLEHEQEILGALQALGIGCAATFSNMPVCYRCIYNGHPVRTWIGECQTTELMP
jgi:hypothetical protein